MKSWNRKGWNICKSNRKCINLASTFQHFNIFNISTFQPWEKPLTIQQLGLKMLVHSKRTFSRLKSWKNAKVEMLKCWNPGNTLYIKIVNISTFEGSTFEDFNLLRFSTFQPWNFFNISRFQPWRAQIKPTVPYLGSFAWVIVFFTIVCILWKAG